LRNAAWSNARPLDCAKEESTPSQNVEHKPSRGYERRGMTSRRYALPRKIRVNGKHVLYDGRFKPGFDVVLANKDVLEFLDTIPDKSVRLIVSSPPYNLGKEYERRIAFDRYLEWQKKVICKCADLLLPDGSICWEVGNYVEDGEIYPLDVFFYDIFKSCGLKLRNRIIWRFGHGLHASKKFSGRYETVLWFTKGDDYVFNLDNVRVRQKYPGKRAFKGPNKGKPASNPLGMNPSDFWEFLGEEWEQGVWNIPNTKFNHPEKTIHPSQFPIELAERLVLALSDEGDKVLDPFVGVGTSIVAAVLHDRIGIGVDKKRRYTDIAFERISEALKGTLPRRELGKPIFQPNGTEKVARIPDEWTAITVSPRERPLFSV
jgi:adenine-specific DNA-methyltransferase